MSDVSAAARPAKSRSVFRTLHAAGWPDVCLSVCLSHTDIRPRDRLIKRRTIYAAEAQFCRFVVVAAVAPSVDKEDAALDWTETVCDAPTQQQLQQ